LETAFHYRVEQHEREHEGADRGVGLLGGLIALLQPGRRRPFAQGLLTGCLIGAAIQGLCMLAGRG